VVVDDGPADVGSTRLVEAVVALGDLRPEDVEVQVVRGVVVGDDDLAHVTVEAMRPGGDAPDGHVRYRIELPCDRAGRHGITVRVVPSHPLLATSVELGCVAWA
jgi:starch phosphorylase